MEAAMEIKVQLDGDELIPDHYAKHADAQHLYHGMPTTSFPFEVTGIPEDAESLAVTKSAAQAPSFRHGVKPRIAVR